MDIWTATRTFLKRNPGSKRKYVLEYVMQKTGYGKSTICEHFSSHELQGKIYRESGCYWLEKPQKLRNNSEVVPFWKKQASEDFTKIRNLIINKDHDDMALVPEATLRCIETYPKIKEKLSSETNKLRDYIKQAYNVNNPDFYFRTVNINRRLRYIANNYVPHVLEKVFSVLHETI